MRSQPLFIIGAPRSGTTFLCNVLNQHPLIELTDECRIFVWLKDLMEVSSQRPDLIGREYQLSFVGFMQRHSGELIERFYREELGTTAPIWGDKHPPYADPCLLSGRWGSLPCLPQSGSSLRLIRETLPTAKFLHIQRDPTQVARSLVSRGWTPSLKDGVEVWRQYETEIGEFLAETDPWQHLTITYRDLVQAPTKTAASIGNFLDLADWTVIEDFLLAQHATPTPFSAPSTDLAATYYDAGHPVQSTAATAIRPAGL